jgi:hypothetical protein
LLAGANSLGGHLRLEFLIMKAPRRAPEQRPLSNLELAQQLAQAADLLDAQHANRYRVYAYRHAAETIRTLAEPIAEIATREGRAGLQALPGIGRSLSRALEQLVQTGHSSLLDQIRSGTRPERLLTTVACIGAKTAARIHDELGIETLADLEAAAYDGRLATLSGIGQKTVRAVRESLAGRFRQRPKTPDSRRETPADLPAVAELLDIDAEYRRKVAADQLPRITPRRFNPSGEAWLPILHTHRADRHYTALFSNTARAHELGTTNDWVVIYREDRDGDGQWTVITALFGKFKGRRIVRGRETECQEYYQAQLTETG